MNTPVLWTIREAAQRLGVPESSLRKVADDFGKTIYIGRAVRLHPDDLPEIIDLCRAEPKAPACIGEREKTLRPSGKLGTEASESRPARTAAAKLKRNSRNTSTANIGQLVRLGPKN